MPNLTQKQKDELAIFAGGKFVPRGVLDDNGEFHGFDGWYFPNGDWVEYVNWSPATKPEHFWLVFAALVKKMGWWYIEEKCRWAIKRAGLPDAYDLDWFINTICDTTLELIEQEGGERGRK